MGLPNRIVFLCVMVLVSGCATLSVTVVPEDKIALEFTGMFIRPLNKETTTWLSVKVENNSEVAFDSRYIQVTDTTNNQILYGGKHGFRGTRFSSDPVKSWSQDLEELQPGQSGYISVNVGDPKGPIITMSISLENTDYFIARKEIQIDIEGVAPINQF